MQEMLDAVRATGRKNVVIAGGLDWAYDFSGILMAGNFPIRTATASFMPIIATTTKTTAWMLGSRKWKRRPPNCR